MKISTKGRYALRIMIDLAINNTGEYIPLKTVASRQGISNKYMEQIIPALGNAGLVKSTRGSQGGYKLSADPNKCTAGDIIRCLEGDLIPVPCAADEDCCERSEQCVSIEVWQQIKTAVDNVVDGITLQNLVDRYYDKTGNNYSI